MQLRKALALAASLAVLAFGAAAQAPLPYKVLEQPQPTDGGGKIEVIEFFWYGCPHCYSLEPFVNSWAKSVPKDVVFKRVPAVPNETGPDALCLHVEGWACWSNTTQVFDGCQGKPQLATQDSRDLAAKNGITSQVQRDADASRSPRKCAVRRS